MPVQVSIFQKKTKCVRQSQIEGNYTQEYEGDQRGAVDNPQGQSPVCLSYSFNLAQQK